MKSFKCLQVFRLWSSGSAQLFSFILRLHFLIRYLKLKSTRTFSFANLTAKPAKKSSIPELKLGLKRGIYRAAKHFWGAPKQHKLRVQDGQVWGDTKMYMSPQRKISSVFWGKTINVARGEENNSPQCCLTFLDNPFFVFQNLYPCYRCILNELQKLYGFYGRQGSEAKCTILAHFFGDLPNSCFILSCLGKCGEAFVQFPLVIIGNQCGGQRVHQGV